MNVNAETVTDLRKGIRMNDDWRSLIWAAMLLGLPSLAAAQPPHRHPEGHPPKPPATVVARVNVNVETDVDVAAGTAAEEEEESDDDAGDKKEASKSGIEELLSAALKQPGAGTSVLVIADININVETSVKVRVPAAKTRDSNAQPAVKNADGDQPKPAGDDSAPKKKKRRKRAVSGEEATAPQPVAPQPTFGLSKLKFGEKLEVGVAGQVESEERARQIATQINQKTSQSLLALALAGMFIPEQSESLGVVRKAVSSVKAEAAGNEISISAAIPRETPQAIKTLVDAAIQKGK
ncbi:MAG TPA: hypothetical protein VM452_03825 [Caulifigura sp.]|nr:hypothetical protein [Caulifigura sp.]